MMTCQNPLYNRCLDLDAQSTHREKIITSKRFKVESLEEAECLLTAAEEKEKVTKAVLKLKLGRNVESLKTLYRCFARDCNSVETFIKSEGLPLLQSCFLSSDSEVLHSAAWCAVNLSAGDSRVVKRVMCLSPTLIQFLMASDRVMQELCAWALANLAGDCQRNKQTLLEQGCLYYLVDLIATKQSVEYEERSRSVLFALINFAKDQTFECISLDTEAPKEFIFLLNILSKVHAREINYQHIVTLSKDTSTNSDLNYEIGWLLNCLYSRPETIKEYDSQLLPILQLILYKLLQLMQIENKLKRERVIIPYIHCVGNIIGQKSELAVAVSEELNFYPVALTCLLCDEPYIQKEILWLLQNFMAEPSCRVLIMCQPKFLTAILNLCHSADADIVLLSINLVETMTKVSIYMSKFLIQNDIIDHLLRLAIHNDHKFIHSALDLLHHLIADEPQEALEKLKAINCKEVLEHLIQTTPKDAQVQIERLLALIHSSTQMFDLF
ncbi:hypothetical protein Btru_074627 [Bulinus truncatus]|nr:hypothetical protein Btru_074627 [Bulinus truncatus]